VPEVLQVPGSSGAILLHRCICRLYDAGLEMFPKEAAAQFFLKCLITTIWHPVLAQRHRFAPAVEL